MNTAEANDLRDLYQDLILDHGKRPRNFHALPSANHEALGHNPLCGDRLNLYVTVDDKGTITDAAFQGSGCAISVASASMMTEMLKGKNASEAAHLFEYMHASCTGKPADEAGIDEDDVARIKALAGVRDFPIRVKCATLAWHTLQAALKNETGAVAVASLGAEQSRPINKVSTE
ncbi:MAG: SUF system NifU family Fe-S cluster assembly protein [Alphaproteobacteria bacterium]|nr:SUF system NifU family Fe-S cluster assembly protein [Alphaproteobacteria bacterium]